jgi:hypothetical protein
MSQKYNWEKQAKIPANPINNASSFAQWVFIESRYTVSNPNSENKNKIQGRVAHLAIDNFFRMQWAHDNLESDSVSDWIIEHTETDGRHGKYYNASSLVINDKPLNCSPDLILRHKEKNRAVIIERKTTEVPPPLIPANGWSNVQAQLWCYSWIDCMLDVEEVTLVGQLWHRVSRKKGLCYMCDFHQMWKRDDKDFHEKSLSWFRLYGGEFQEQNK